jgi:hypothetical protein
MGFKAWMGRWKTQEDWYRKKAPTQPPPKKPEPPEPDYDRDQ